MHPVLAVNKASGRFPFALRAAIAVAGPVLVTTLLLGDSRLGLMAGLGSFTVLYGANTAGRFRARLLPTMGLGLTASAALGVATHAHGWLNILAMAVVAVVASALAGILKVGPPGAYFLVLVCGVAGFMTAHGQPGWLVVLMTGIGAVVSVAVGLADLLWAPYGAETRAVAAAGRALARFEAADGDLSEARALASQSLHHAWATVRDAGSEGSRLQPIAAELTGLQPRYEHRSAQVSGALAGFDVHPWGAIEGEEADDDSALTGVDREQLRDSSLGRPDAAYLLRRGLTWPSETFLVTARVGLAALIAGALALVLPTAHPYWAVAFAVLVLHQGGRRSAQTVRGVQRLLGAAVGLVLYGLILLWHPQGLWLVLLLGVLQFAIEMLVVRNYAMAVTFITPLALTIASASGSREEPLHVITERAFDCLLAVGVALVVLWTVGLGTALLLARANARRSILAMEPVLDALAGHRLDTPDAARDRRHLYFELLELQHMADQSWADEPARLRPYLSTFVAVAHLGYAVLGACWHPDSERAREAAGRVRQALTRITRHPVAMYRDPVSLRDDVLRAADELREWTTDEGPGSQARRSL